MSSIVPTFQGEIQLAGWSDTHNGGAKVTFWLTDATDLESFRALTIRKGNHAGHRFAAVLVEIGDDEQPVQPVPHQKGGELAKLAGQFCNNPDFWKFLHAKHGWACSMAEDAAKLIRQRCHINSRSELDHKPEAASIFHEQFREPFVEWQRWSKQ